MQQFFIYTVVISICSALKYTIFKIRQSADRNNFSLPKNFSFFEYQLYQPPTDKVRFSIKMAHYNSNFKSILFEPLKTSLEPKWSCLLITIWDKRNFVPDYLLLLMMLKQGSVHKSRFFILYLIDLNLITSSVHTTSISTSLVLRSMLCLRSLRSLRL